MLRRLRFLQRWLVHLAVAAALVATFINPVNAIGWVQVHFSGVEFAVERPIVREFLGDEIVAAERAYPESRVDILIGHGNLRRKAQEPENPIWINAYIRGGPHFCSDIGCTMILLRRGDSEEGEWTQTWRGRSNGYLMVTDIVRNGMRNLVVENNIECFRLISLGNRYGIDGIRRGPCIDRVEQAKEDAVSALADETRRALRREKITYRGFSDHGLGVRLEILSEADMSIAVKTLGSVADKFGTNLSNSGRSFSLQFDEDAFSDVSEFFVQE